MTTETMLIEKCDLQFRDVFMRLGKAFIQLEDIFDSVTAPEKLIAYTTLKKTIYEYIGVSQ